MKKTLFVFALAAVLVLSFSTVAMAKYAGYAYNTNGGGNVGYLSWAGAKALMTANGVPANLQTSAHGNYTANTTKCAVCHSVHRAATDRTAAGVGAYYKLTPGAQACTACHTAWGANPIPSALIEWANPVDGDAGPHTHANTPNACLGSCHAGVHGGTMSVYGAVQAYNLTNRNDAAIAAAFAAGNAASWANQPNSAAVVSGGGTHGDYYYGSFDETQFRNNDYAAGVNPSYPTQNSTREAMRAMVTGYTCGASGCHSSSQFAVNQNGYAEARAGDPSNPNSLNTFMTGHSTNMIGGCEPCHIGTDSKCAACHDMKGQATNSSAFPHGNRNISVYETEANGSTTTTMVPSYNLWMYSGDGTRRDAGGAPSATGTASPARKVIYGVSHGGPGTTPATFHIGDIRDGVCLKCHGYKYFGPSYFTHSPEANFARK